MPNPTTETIGSVAVVNEMFLTPRVIDAGAFGKYSAVLRELIESSVEASARLAEERERAETAIERAGGLGDGERRAGGEAETPGAVDRASAERIARLEATVAELAGRLEQAEASASEARSIARGGRDAASGGGDLIGSELTPEFDEALARAEAAEDRLRKLIGMAEAAGEELSERVGDVVHKAASSGAELTAMIMMLAEQIEKAEALGELGGQGGTNGETASLAAHAPGPIDAETLRTIGELVERVSEAVRIATEKTETLESMNIRADASGEALLRAVRSATDGAVNAESIADRLTLLIARAEAVGASVRAPTVTPTITPTPPTTAAVSPAVRPGVENLAAGERLALGGIGVPAEPSEVSVRPGVRDLRSFVERAAALDPEATPSGPRPFPPTPIDPAIVSKPQLRRPERPIDAEDFGS